MGKGGGCVPSKKKKPSSLATTSDGPGIDDNDATASAPIPVEDDQTTIDGDRTAGTTTPAINTDKISPLKIFVVFYSMYGHVESLARRMKKGVDSVEGVEATLYRVPETLSQEVVEKMKAPPKDSEIPEIRAAELAAADGFLFGFPTRYGCMAAQMERANTRRKACWILRQYRDSRRWPRDYCANHGVNYEWLAEPRNQVGQESPPLSTG